MPDADLHTRLVAKQSEDELRRKAEKARTRLYWTQEEIDYIERRADRWSAAMKWE